MTDCYRFVSLKLLKTSATIHDEQYCYLFICRVSVCHISCRTVGRRADVLGVRLYRVRLAASRRRPSISTEMSERLSVLIVVVSRWNRTYLQEDGTAAEQCQTTSVQCRLGGRIVSVQRVEQQGEVGKQIGSLFFFLSPRKKLLRWLPKIAADG